VNDDTTLHNTRLVAPKPETVLGPDLFLRFEWTPVKPDRVAFKFFIVRGQEQSVIAFELGLNELSPLSFERLEHFLRQYQDQTLPGNEVASHLVWLLEHALSDLGESARRQQLLDLLLLATPPPATAAHEPVLP
jgi:hypothetical protein